LLRRITAEFLGTGILVAAVVGSGTMATELSTDLGIDLLINAAATVLALAVLIQVLGPISGAHFNPVVSLSEWALGRLSRTYMLSYVSAQFLGGLVGVFTANLMFKNPAIYMSEHVRSGSHLFLGEVVATAGLLLLIQLVRQPRNSAVAPIVIAAWIGSAYFFTSSTSFANPAVTLARAFTDTFSGIAMGSVLAFIAAQIIGASLGTLLGKYLNPSETK
jgi:glycerol uptake facilitator-like aquaporin